MQGSAASGVDLTVATSAALTNGSSRPAVVLARASADPGNGWLLVSERGRVRQQRRRRRGDWFALDTEARRPPARTPAPRSKQRRHQRRRWLRLAKAKHALGTSRSVFGATLRGAPPTELASGAELFSFLPSEPIRSGSELGPPTAQVVPEESIAATASTNRP